MKRKAELTKLPFPSPVRGKLHGCTITYWSFQIEAMEEAWHKKSAAEQHKHMARLAEIHDMCRAL